MSGEIRIGEEITIAGESFKVLSNSDGMVTLEDGSKFGTQKVPANESLWFDVEASPFLEAEDSIFETVVDVSEKIGYEPVDEFNSADPETVDEIIAEAAAEQGADPSSLPDDRGTAQAGESQGSREGIREGSREGQVKRPSSKMDIRNADSREILAAEGGIRLTRS